MRLRKLVAVLGIIVGPVLLLGLVTELYRHIPHTFTTLLDNGQNLLKSQTEAAEKRWENARVAANSSASSTTYNSPKPQPNTYYSPNDACCLTSNSNCPKYDGWEDAVCPPNDGTRMTVVFSRYGERHKFCRYLNDPRNLAMWSAWNHQWMLRSIADDDFTPASAGTTTIARAQCYEWMIIDGAADQPRMQIYLTR
jgi:hypothetical protein